MNMNEDLHPTEMFFREIEARVASYKHDQPLKEASRRFLLESGRNNYSFNFSWLGRPVIQIPQDLFVLQELIWKTRPDFIIETGIAHGGSTIFFASMLELTGKGKVIAIDIDIRPHNRNEIEKHPLSHRIVMLEGDSVSPELVSQVTSMVKGAEGILVCLDSNHTHEHVLKELNLYAPLVTVGSYCVVFDTGVEDLPPEMIIDRPWGPGNNPKTAVWEFLQHDDRFVIDKEIEEKILLTAAPDGYLRRLK
jgi:cephalosporin hydroxylase